MNKKEKKKSTLYEYGMIGLGTMGRNLVFNMNDNGFSVAGFDKDKAQVNVFTKEAADRNIKGYTDLSKFVDSLETPRIIMLLVPAGHIVDAVIDELKPFLGKGDLLIDCGNSHFTDTNRRIEQMAEENFHFMGMGISGGEEGARHGPSIMPGGAKEDYNRISVMLEKIAAKANKKPCVTWLGPGSAGHYVKMVHNGIEYGLMQLIAEHYHLLKETAELDNEGLHAVFSKFNKGKLHSYLIGITADIFLQKDDLTSHSLIDMIKDSAAQNGTGAWTSEDAMGLLAPVPVIDTAVSSRILSTDKRRREKASAILKGSQPKAGSSKVDIIINAEKSLYFSMIATYAEGIALLQVASEKYKYNLKPEMIAKIWRGGCIIRASLLDDIMNCFAREPGMQNIMLDKKLSKELQKSQEGMRNIVQTATGFGVPMPATMASLAYYDSFRSSWLPANLIQAQRDCFGAHTYNRIDRKGIFHTQWNIK